MKNKLKIFLGQALAAAVFLAAAGASHAQGLSFFQPVKSGDKKRTGKTPTVITSDTMDIDISKNTAVFTGNVKVDDEEMSIECKIMTIFLEDRSPSAAAPNTEAPKTEAPKTGAAEKPAAVSPEDKPEESKQVSRIICEKNVVIIRKSLSDSEKTAGEQKALAGHADYDVKTGKIVLTKDPMLQRGTDTLKGEIIVIWRDSEKVEVQKGEIKMDSENVDNKEAIPAGKGADGK